ncbi:MAG: T9SS type A sorting domain-containing protein [Bacteroidota bacterium]
MKRIVQFTFLLLSLCLSHWSHGSPVHIQGTTGTLFALSSHKADVGDTITANLSAFGFEDVSLLNITLQWDPQVLELVDTLPTASNFYEVFVREIDEANGTLVFRFESDWETAAREVASFYQLQFRLISDPGSSNGSEIAFDVDPDRYDYFNLDFVPKSLAVLHGRVLSATPCTLATGAMLQMTEPSCDGTNRGSINIQPFGPGSYTYAWTYPDGSQNTTQNISNVEAGAYDLIMAESCGLPYRLSFQLLQENEPQIVPTLIQSVGCAGESNGIIEVLATGGQGGPYRYTWAHTTDNTNRVEQLSEGLYNLTVTDAGGCSTEEVFEITAASNLMMKDVAIRCATPGQSNGSISLCMADGVPPYDYLWSTGEITAEINGLPQGSNYSVTVTDQIGCFFTNNFTIDEGGQILRLTPFPDTAICAGLPLTLGVDAPGAIFYDWSPDSLLSCDDCPNPIIRFQEDVIATVRVIFADGCEDRGQIELKALDCVWPGDTDDNNVVNNFDLLNIGIGFGSTGPVRTGASLNWMAQPASDWDLSLPNSNVNYKHIDCDGDGIIGFSDTTAIVQNWGLVHMAIGNAPAQDRRMDLPFFIQPDTFVPNAMVRLPVILGDSINPAQDVYGLAFSIDYDTDLIVPSSVRLSFANSWMGDLNSDLMAIQNNVTAEGRLDVAVTRIDQQNISGSGMLAELFITIEDDIFVHGGGSTSTRGNDNKSLAFDISNVRLINVTEESLSVVPTKTESTIESTTVSTQSPFRRATDLKLFPNPTRNQLIVETSSGSIQQLDVIGIDGQLLQSQKVPKLQRTHINVGALPEGSYLLKALTANGWSIQRFVILK